MKAATAIAEFLSRTGIGEEAAFGIDMAVREGIANAIIHGNKLDETKFVTINVTKSPDSLEIRSARPGTGVQPRNHFRSDHRRKYSKDFRARHFLYAQLHGSSRMVGTSRRWYVVAHDQEDRKIIKEI